MGENWNTEEQSGNVQTETVKALNNELDLTTAPVHTLVLLPLDNHHESLAYIKSFLTL